MCHLRDVARVVLHAVACCLQVVALFARDVLVVVLVAHAVRVLLHALLRVPSARCSQRRVSFTRCRARY